jgi:PAS domain S-box-containing protein
MLSDFQISELRYRRLFETAQDGILLIDFKTGMILDVNKFLIDLLDYSKKDFLKRYLWEIGVFKDIAASKKNFETLQKKRYVRFENLPLETKSGKKINVEFIANAYSVGNKTFIQCNIRDISDRVNAENKLENSEILFRELFENMSSGVAIYEVKNNGRDFIFKDFNKASEILEKIKKEKIIGKNVVKIFPDVKKFGLYRILQKVWKTGKPERHPLSLYKDKRIFGWRENFVYKLPNGNIVAIYDDVTQRKEAEEKIKWLATYPVLNPRPIVEIDKKDGIIYINPAAEKLFPDLQKKQLNHLFVKKSLKYFSKLNFTDKTSNEREVEIHGRWYLQTFYLVNSNRLRIYANDVTDVKKANEKILELKDRDESILESIGDAVFACDKNGTILLFNKVASEMTCFSDKEAIGNNYRKIIKVIKEGDENSKYDIVCKTIKENKITKMSNHVLLIAKDGHKIPVSNSASPFKDIYGNTVGCVVVLHDMTKEYQTDKAKTEFVSLASHQMRTPLTAINWYTEVLKSLKYGSLNNKQSEYVSEIENASKRMTTLIDSLLNVSRLEMGTFIIDPVFLNLSNLIKNTIEIFILAIEKKNLIVKQNYDTDVSHFFADPQLLGMVLQNIFSNAIKYTPKGGKITFTVKKENDLFKIILSDNGIGIPLNEQNKIFEKFFRGDNVRIIDPNGSGLGLYIVHEIINNSGGKIWFESEEEKGTTFYITFPLTGMIKKEGAKRIV